MKKWFTTNNEAAVIKPALPVPVLKKLNADSYEARKLPPSNMQPPKLTGAQPLTSNTIYLRLAVTLNRHSVYEICS